MPGSRRNRKLRRDARPASTYVVEIQETGAADGLGRPMVVVRAQSGDLMDMFAPPGRWAFRSGPDTLGAALVQLQHALHDDERSRDLGTRSWGHVEN